MVSQAEWLASRSDKANLRQEKHSVVQHSCNEQGASVAKLYSYTVPLRGDLLNTYCVLQKGFTDQFVSYRKDRPQRYLGLGRCIAIASREDLDHVLQGEVALPHGHVLVQSLRCIQSQTGR